MEFIGIDHGNAQVKTTNSCHPSYRFDLLPYEPAHDVDGPTVVSGENGMWFIEKAGTTVPYEKAKLSEDWLTHTKIAIGDELIFRDKNQKSGKGKENYKAEVVLGVGVPNDSIVSQADISDFESFFRDASPIRFKYKGKNFDITVIQCYCFRQGRVLLRECDRTAPGSKTAVIDVGGYTTDSYIAKFGEDRRMSILNSGSIKSGINEMRRDLASIMTNVMGRNVTIDVVDSWFRHPKRLPGLIGQKNYDVFDKQKVRWASELLSDISEQIFGGTEYADMNRIIIAGGGALALGSAITKALTERGVTSGSIKVLNDPVKANAEGFEAAARARWNLDQKRKSGKRAN